MYLSTSMQDQGRIREFYVYICDSRARNIFLGIFYGYKTLLQVSHSTLIYTIITLLVSACAILYIGVSKHTMKVKVNAYVKPEW